jgi:hypothetical protein
MCRRGTTRNSFVLGQNGSFQAHRQRTPSLARWLGIRWDKRNIAPNRQGNTFHSHTRCIVCDRSRNPCRHCTRNTSCFRHTAERNRLNKSRKPLVLDNSCTFRAGKRDRRFDHPTWPVGRTRRDTKDTLHLPSVHKSRRCKRYTQSSWNC